MKLDLYTQTGEKKGQVDASDVMFAAKINQILMHQAITMQQGNQRRAQAKAKTRGEVTGSTRKIYRQKGTGNARHGSRYANLFRGGGVVFGPTGEQNYKKMMPKKQKRAALFSALTFRASKNEVIALESFDLKDSRTKEAKAIIAKLPIAKNALIVEPTKNVILENSLRNLHSVKVLNVGNINIVDLMKYGTIIFLKDALKKLEENLIKAN